MKPTDLMISDWVKWKDKYVQIATISGIVYSFGHIDVEIAYCGSGLIERHDLKSISPIPLTSEILERNGFELRDGFFYHRIDDKPHHYDWVHDVKIITDTVTISKDRYEQLLQYEHEYISRQSMINSFMQNK